ncbi:hypothetical protein EVAR_71771_1 [Eumeta japonica]|uniref:Uncharacterized protein n=1 Tax=Eumeta variegata TaxID=151549 RepID=A0A4C1SJF8_EUMVA|nr:hypothetical protein EVAR_71771_1 [Eumeta japonica]
MEGFEHITPLSSEQRFCGVFLYKHQVPLSLTPLIHTCSNKILYRRLAMYVECMSGIDIPQSGSILISSMRSDTKFPNIDSPMAYSKDLLMTHLLPPIDPLGHHLLGIVYLLIRPSTSKGPTTKRTYRHGSRSSSAWGRITFGMQTCMYVVRL